MRMLGNNVYYIKDTNKIIRMNILNKSTTLVGQTPDAVLSFCITQNVPRPYDLETCKLDPNQMMFRDQSDLENIRNNLKN